ncbi:MAG: response regulator transcription factor [Bacteroidales bacterium]|nr:response regulator transcription factor [Bacteroidales bacterium]
MRNESYRILLVDDEADILEFLSYNLRKEGYQVFTADNGKDALYLAGKKNPHLVLLDVMMPGMDGMETCERMRKIPEMKQAVIVFLTARGEEYSQLAGFDAGADDYLVKPVKLKVLLKRVAALLKRVDRDNSPMSMQVLEAAGLHIDKERYTVTFGEKPLLLPRKEFELLYLLASRPGRLFTREEIFLRIWGDDVIVGDRTLDVHIRKLREKLGNDVILTVKGVGYKLKE